MGTWAAEAPRCSRIVSPAPGGQAVDEHVRPPVERRPRALPVNLRVADRADPAGERRRERADGRDRPLAGLGIPRADHPGRHDGPAVLPGGDERQRRGPHDVRDDGELPGGRLRGGGRPGDHLGARREHRHPAGGLAGLVEPEPQPGRDAEVAAAAPKRPEEPGMGVLVRLEQPAAGGDHFGAEDVVDREPVLADQEAGAAAEGDPPTPALAVSPSPVASPCSPAALV